MLMWLLDKSFLADASAPDCGDRVISVPVNPFAANLLNLLTQSNFFSDDHRYQLEPDLYLSPFF